jgi:uncharacterized protein with PIN domain
LRFISDGMLGKLTRWLRLLGYDAKYSNKLDDAQLIALAKKERRILLTKDLGLYQRAITKGIKAFYLDGKTEAERLANLSKRYKIKLVIDMTKSRCTKCNAVVKSIPKEEVADKVEKNTFLHYEDFWECPKCGQIYWQGAHWTKIETTLNQAKKELKKQKCF